MAEPYRWHAVVRYRSEATGTVDVEHDLVELEEIHDLVEQGPHWDAIESIDITIRRAAGSEKLTLERAAVLLAGPA